MKALARRFLRYPPWWERKAHYLWFLLGTSVLSLAACWPLRNHGPLVIPVTWGVYFASGAVVTVITELAKRRKART